MKNVYDMTDDERRDYALLIAANVTPQELLQLPVWVRKELRKRKKRESDGYRQLDLFEPPKKPVNYG